MGSQSSKLRVFVSEKISKLEDCDEAYIRASLAKLRHGLGKKPGTVPDIGCFVFEDMPESLWVDKKQRMFAERAVHEVMTLFALHQQGKNLKVSSMSRSGRFLGNAVRRLILLNGKKSEKPIKRRFDAMITSDNLEELSYHLRGMIQLLKSKSIPLDYPKLAKQLFEFQIPEYQDNVRLDWMQEYYYKKEKDKNND